MSPRAQVTYKFFTAFSYPPHMVPSSIFPFLWGKGYGGGYWGPFTDYTDTEGYLGILPIILALVTVACSGRRNLHIRFFGIVGIVAFMLSFGKFLPLYKILYHLPFFSYFRMPARHWLEVSMAVSVLFSLGMTQYLDESRRTYGRVLLSILLLTIGVTVVPLVAFKEQFHAFVISMVNPMRPHAVESSLSLSSPVVYIPLVFMFLYAAWLFVMKSNGKAPALKYLVVLIVLAEALIFRQASGSGPQINHMENMCKEGAIGFLTGRGDGRVAFIHEKLHPLQGAMCGLRMIDGFEQLVNKDYNTLLGLETSGSYSNWPRTLANNAVLSMLNAKYLVVSSHMESFVSNVRGRHALEGEARDLEGPIFSPPFAYMPYPYKDLRHPVYRKIYSDRTGAVYQNLNALPLVYSARNLKPVSGVEGATSYMRDGMFDPRREAMLSTDDINHIGAVSFYPASVKVKAYSSGKVELESSSKGRSFIVLSEQYYPGWKAYVDGNETALYRTNGVLKGVVVPGGRHEIMFVYRPKGIYASFAIAFISVLAVCFALVKLPSTRV
jgi:hypothetical protein